ncbi:MAG: hypothetical protein HPY69_19570 [Armatimonadetes bacterium]|nr:hypothetical protein [Armatimonadota bacterium]
MQTPRWRQPALLIAMAALSVVLISASGWAQTGNGEQQLVNIDVKDAPIEQVLRMLAKAANVNILVGQDVQGNIQSVSLRDVTVEAALRLIAKAHGFNWWKEDNVYVVSKQAPPAEATVSSASGPQASGSSATTVATPAAGSPGGVPLVGSSPAPGPLTDNAPRSQAPVTAGPPPLVAPPTATQGTRSVAAEPTIKTEMIPLAFADAGQLATMFGGTVVGGGGTYDTLSGAIRPSQLRKANSFSRGGGLSGSDVFQGGFGAPSSGANLGWGQFTGGGGGGRGSRGGGGTTTGGFTGGTTTGSSRLSGGSGTGGGVLGAMMPGEMEPPIAYLPENALLVQGTQEDIDKFREILDLLDKPSKQVEISTRFIEVQTNASKALGIDWTMANGSLEFFNQGFAPGEAVNTVVRFARGNFEATLAALISSGRGTVVNEPSVVAMNNQYAEINFSTTIPYFVANISYNQFGQRTVDFTNEEIDVENSLFIQPRINADDTVTVLLEPELEDVVGEVEGPNGERVPIVTSQFISTTVRVADGETVVMGGLIRKQETYTLRETPLLSQIPIIGKLFQGRRTVKNNSELLVFVTPKIVRDVPTQ